MKIIDVLDKKGRTYHTIPAHESFSQILKLLVTHGVGSLVVTDSNGATIGIVSERTLIEALSRMGARAFDKTAKSVMRSPVPSCRPDHTIRQGLSTMTTLRTRHLVVCDSAETYGVVSIGDLVKYRLQDTELENLVLRDMAGARHLASSGSALRRFDKAG
ncbi:MAG: CBS domain-containing protein [Alphaproteobacteria bacterium]|nr:CBS domain-containing protein [Alphaproteobacteria bacterium]